MPTRAEITAPTGQRPAYPGPAGRQAAPPRRHSLPRRSGAPGARRPAGEVTDAPLISPHTQEAFRRRAPLAPLSGRRCPSRGPTGPRTHGPGRTTEGAPAGAGTPSGVVLDCYSE